MLTDCPQREQSGGRNVQIFAPTASFNAEIVLFCWKWLQGIDTEGRILEICLIIDPYSTDRVGFRIREKADHERVIGYDVAVEESQFDRSNVGAFFEEDFCDEMSRSSALLKAGTIKLPFSPIAAQTKSSLTTDTK